MNHKFEIHSRYIKLMRVHDSISDKVYLHNLYSPKTALLWAPDVGAVRFPHCSQHRARNALNTAWMCGSRENLGPPRKPPTGVDARHLEF